MNNEIYITDVFADGKYSGNPLAVVIVKNALSDELMQKIAAEINFSETTFVDPHALTDGSFLVRIFTPSKELDFAGHPILGTAAIIRDYLIKNDADVISLKLSQAKVDVTFEDSKNKEIVWFNAPPITLEDTIEANDIVNALGLTLDDIKLEHPIQKVSAGTSAVIVPIRTLDALKRSMLNLDKYSPLLKKRFPPLIYLFTNETRNEENDYSVRFFFDAHGVREDPATGNGAAFFGKYILKHKIDSNNPIVRIEQGHEVGRPSLVMLHAETSIDNEVVRVGGQVVTVVKGNLL